MKTIEVLLILAATISFQHIAKGQTVEPSNASAGKMLQARVFIKPDKKSDFVREAELMILKSKNEVGCKSYQLLQDPYEENVFLFLEEYQDQKAIDFHFATNYFKEFVAKISDWQSKKMEIKFYDISNEVKI